MALPKILVIEDNEADVDLLKMVIESEIGPHDFELLEDGGAALKFVREHRAAQLPTDPCVIVLDLGLPRHSGIEVLEEIRRSPALTHIQVLVLSTLATPAQREQVENLGGVYREKPLSAAGFRVLAALIGELCRTPLVTAAAHS